MQAKHCVLEWYQGAARQVKLRKRQVQHRGRFDAIAAKCQATGSGLT